jgi:hypothetical protein
MNRWTFDDDITHLWVEGPTVNFINQINEKVLIDENLEFETIYTKGVDMKKELLTTTAAAKALGRSCDTLRRWAIRGEQGENVPLRPKSKVGKYYLWDAKELKSVKLPKYSRGRPGLSDEDLKRAKSLLSYGKTYADVASEIGISTSALYTKIPSRKKNDGTRAESEEKITVQPSTKTSNPTVDDIWQIMKAAQNLVYQCQQKLFNIHKEQQGFKCEGAGCEPPKTIEAEVEFHCPGINEMTTQSECDQYCDYPQCAKCEHRDDWSSDFERAIPV